MKRALVVLAAVFLAACPQLGSQEEMVDVLVAKKNVPKEFPLDETMLGLAKIPKRYVQPKALRHAHETLGQIAAVTIFEGTQITATMLVTRDDAGVAFGTPKGYRAFTLPVDPAAPVGDVRPKSYVDLVHVRPLAKGTGTEAATLLQNVYVLATDESAGRKTITLMLTLNEVLVVALAQETGGVRVAVRSAEEGNTQVRPETNSNAIPMQEAPR